jgi:flagellar biosynthetic protein FliP
MRPANSTLSGLLVVFFLLAADTAWAQGITISVGDEGSVTSASVQLIALVTLLALAPGILVTITCFPFIVTVLAILRQAIGLQQSPPNMLLVSLALFLTYFVMEPVFQQAWDIGIGPATREELSWQDGLSAAADPFRAFMSQRLDPETFQAMVALRPEMEPFDQPKDAPLSVILPSFMLSEIARAFQIGFLIFLPFLIIDLLVAAVLMSMGMMMVPPVIVSLPFKLVFFVVADGWALISSALVRGYF